MYLSQITIKNYRLLETVELSLEDHTTVIVGRNNSGKTSLTEFFRHILEEGSPRFHLEDFSLGVYDNFWAAFELYQKNAEEEEIRKVLPCISAELTVDYKDSVEDYGPLGIFIIDLDPESTSTQINIQYRLDDGNIKALFSELENDRSTFFKMLKERVPMLFKMSVEAQDPNDVTNRESREFSSLRALFKFGFINAQRALDDITHSDKAVLGKILEALFTAAASETANPKDHTIAEKLKSAVSDIQDSINDDFNNQLYKLFPAFQLLGYPGLSDPELRTDTILKVEQLLSNHTVVGYEGVDGVNLPESYNGLGPRNLIFILLKIFEFFREFTNALTISGVHLIFIEEPEAHQHPQMQNVFIRKLSEISELFANEFNDGIPWPVQFVVTTHSSHITNEAQLNSMRYFLAQQHKTIPRVYTTVIKDLRLGLSNEPDENLLFIHKYMTLTRCDLLFADKAILIEGTSERLLLPKIIKKFDESQSEGDPQLGRQYLSIMEVNGAYAHRFYNLLEFLNLRTLVITDLDSIDAQNNRSKCKVSEGTHSSNAGINKWFTQNGEDDPTIDNLLAKNDLDKITNNRRLAFQIPHTSEDACGRSFEDAFMLANSDLFDIKDTTAEDREEHAWTEARKVDKTKFALEHAIEITDWNIPKYIVDGLLWLAQNNSDVADVKIEHTAHTKTEIDKDV